MPDTVPIKDYIDTRFDATNLAIEKAEAAANRLHDVSNNIAASMLTKAEYNIAHGSLEKKTDSTQKLVWIGLGVLLTVQFLIGIAVLIGWWKK